MQNIQYIELNKLKAWPGNVRQTGAEDGIDELAASIDAHGLLQSLVVHEDAAPTGIFSLSRVSGGVARSRNLLKPASAPLTPRLPAPSRTIYRTPRK